jgi:hypothetical protein
MTDGANSVQPKQMAEAVAAHQARGEAMVVNDGDVYLGLHGPIDSRCIMMRKMGVSING